MITKIKQLLIENGAKENIQEIMDIESYYKNKMRELYDMVELLEEELYPKEFTYYGKKEDWE